MGNNTYTAYEQNSKQGRKKDSRQHVPKRICGDRIKFSLLHQLAKRGQDDPWIGEEQNVPDSPSGKLPDPDPEEDREEQAKNLFSCLHCSRNRLQGPIRRWRWG